MKKIQNTELAAPQIGQIITISTKLVHYPSSMIFEAVSEYNKRVI